MALLWDSRDPVIRTVWEKVYAQQLVRVKDAVLYLSPVFLPGQGAITLLCLQRTPDQTITLSGSQTAPKGSDSTDKWALGSPSHWGERDHTPLEQRQQCIRKTSFLQFHYIWWAASTAALLPPSSNFVELKVARNSRGKSNGNVLSSLPTPSLLTLWLWTSSGLTVMIPLRNAPQIHLSPPSVPSRSVSGRPQGGSRDLNKGCQREEAAWQAIAKWDEPVLGQQLLSNNTRYHFSHLYMFFFYFSDVGWHNFYLFVFLARLSLSILGMLWYLPSADSHDTYTTNNLFIKSVFRIEIFLNKHICYFYEIGKVLIFPPLFGDKMV